MDIKELAGWVSILMVFLTFITFVTKPVINSFTKISRNLTDITHTLDLINRSIEQSQSDRLSLHNDIQRHDERLDAHDRRLDVHSEQIKTLFNQGGKNNG